MYSLTFGGVSGSLLVVCGLSFAALCLLIVVCGLLFVA